MERGNEVEACPGQTAGVFRPREGLWNVMESLWKVGSWDNIIVATFFVLFTEI